MKDIVIGAITNYSFDHIKRWVNSLDRSGFSGLKILVCYNIHYETIEQLVEKNYTIFAFDRDDDNQSLVYKKQDFNICLDRFAHIPFFLNRIADKSDFRYIISTDVRDVIFQSNPSEYLEKNLEYHEILASCESLKYEDEPWGRSNMQQSFGPVIYDRMKDKNIYNAGVIAGKFETILDLFTNIYLSCGASPVNVPGGGGPDQAGYNVLLSLNPYKNITKYCMSEDGWAAQLGTTVDPRKIESFKEHLLEPSPILVNDLVCTSTGTPHVIVHQYDRVPEWNSVIEKKYE